MFNKIPTAEETFRDIDVYRGTISKILDKKENLYVSCCRHILDIFIISCFFIGFFTICFFIMCGIHQLGGGIK